jgi:hypothetical protein
VDGLCTNRVASGSIAAVYIYFLGPLIFAPYARDVAGAVTRTEFSHAKIVKPSSDSGRGAARDVRKALSEDAERTGGCEMAPDVESALDGGIVTKPVGHHGVLRHCFSRSMNTNAAVISETNSTARGRLGARRIVVNGHPSFDGDLRI